MILLSIVVPCFNEEETIPIFYDRITDVSDKMNEKYGVEFEYIFIDDGSRDKTLKLIKDLSLEDKRVKYISFSRNFGKEAGLYAGLEASRGDYVAVMDVDLQDPPELLEEMYNTVIGGEYDCAATRRTTRKGEPPVRSFFAKCFYKLINRISRAEITDGARDFRLITRRMTDAILEMKEYNRFSKGIFGWVGFRTRWIEYENVERAAGTTKWSFFKLLLYSIDGITAFSTVPLMIASVMGLLFCFIAFVMIVVIIAKTIAFGDPVAGYPSLVCIIFLMSGVQLFSVGILGQYLSKTYLETKDRPKYIVREANIDKRR